MQSYRLRTKLLQQRWVRVPPRRRRRLSLATLLPALLLIGMALVGAAGCQAGGNDPDRQAPAPVEPDPPLNELPETPDADPADPADPAEPDESGESPEQPAEVDPDVPVDDPDGGDEPDPPVPPPGSVFKSVHWDVDTGELSVEIDSPGQQLYVRMSEVDGLYFESDWRYGSWQLFPPDGGTATAVASYLPLVAPGERRVLQLSAFEDQWNSPPVEEFELPLLMPEMALSTHYDARARRVTLHAELLERWRSQYSGTFRVSAYSWGSLAVDPGLLHLPGPEFTVEYQLEFDRYVATQETLRFAISLPDSQLGTRYHSVEVDLPAIIRADDYDNTTRQLLIDIDNSTDPQRQRDVVVTCRMPDGHELPAELIAGGLGQASFTLPPMPEDAFLHVEATDSAGNSDWQDVYAGGWVGALPDDTIVAVPLQTRVDVGEPVRVQVAIGRPASLFHYMNGVMLVAPVESGMEYVPKSFNIGKPGGERLHPDGAVWTRMGVSDFLMLSDRYSGIHLDYESDRLMDFSVTPMHGRNTRQLGELFNFEVTFTNAGKWPLNFMPTTVFDGIARTYYQEDNQQQNIFWGDSSNSLPGLPNSITVE